MFYLFRPINLFVLGTYLVLSALPFFPLLLGKPVSNPIRLLGMECVAWLTVWSVFKRPAWFHWLLLPAFIGVPIEIYLRIYFGQGISTHHLGIMAETSPKESIEFLGNKVWLLLGVAAGVLAWWGLSWRAAFRTRDLDWRDGSRWLTMVALAIGLGVWLYAQEIGIRPEPASVVAQASPAATGSSDDSDETDDAEDGEASASASVSVSASGPSLLKPALQAVGVQTANLAPLPSWAKIPFESDAFGQTWPFGMIVNAYDFWKERRYLSELAHKSKLFKFGAHQQDHSSDPEIVVMVIGESSRYDRWSLNGYSRETNPLLKKEPNLTALSNVITAVSATRLSVPVLVSRKPATQSLKAGFSEKSFLSAFKEAGYKTYWLSNQMSFGQFDTPISVFANEADVTQFMNLGGFTNNSSFDQILLDPLKNAINDPALKKLIVLHSLGNHWNYSHRHPKEFDKWQPSLFGIVNPAYTDTKLKPQLNNSYDNSILYTDWFLAQVIGQLKATKQLASMMYISDHGQTLYDGTCNLAFHGHNTEYEFHVPALVWLSDSYKEAYPDKVEQLKRRRNAKLATENVFHSLLDMASIKYDTEHLEWSFFSKKFKLHKRYVDSYGWTDYDNSTFKGDCREVIDKGKPLVQEK